MKVLQHEGNFELCNHSRSSAENEEGEGVGGVKCLCVFSDITIKNSCSTIDVHVVCYSDEWYSSRTISWVCGQLAVFRLKQFLE